jgi:RIO-like serine/threonine protein kinase
VIMEIIDGVTVKEFCVKGRKLEKSHLVDIFEIFTKLALLNLTHYDVHEENILVSNNKTV